MLLLPVRVRLISIVLLFQGKSWTVFKLQQDFSVYLTNSGDIVPKGTDSIR